MKNEEYFLAIFLLQTSKLLSLVRIESVWYHYHRSRGHSFDIYDEKKGSVTLESLSHL